jgi:uncharacterized phiE125 gp8 family phage protein
MLRVITKADADPVSLEEAKKHLRIDYDDDDDTIAALISAATLQAQSVTQRRFVTQTVEYVLQHWHHPIELPIKPVAKDGVVSITYVDWVTQAPLVLDPSQYVVKTDGETVSIIRAYSVIWPLVFKFSPEPIVIQFKVGTAVADVPANVKAAIKLTVGHLYENRQDVIIASTRSAIAELPLGAMSLLLSETW